MGRGHLNWWSSLSDYKFVIHNQEVNAAVSGGLTHGWFVTEYDSTLEKFRVKLIQDADDDLATEVLAQSDNLAASVLPATVTLAQVGGSGITATVYINSIK